MTLPYSKNSTEASEFFRHVVRISQNRFPNNYEWICSGKEKSEEAKEKVDSVLTCTPLLTWSMI